MSILVNEYNNNIIIILIFQLRKLRYRELSKSPKVT